MFEGLIFVKLCFTKKLQKLQKKIDEYYLNEIKRSVLRSNCKKDKTNLRAVIIAFMRCDRKFEVPIHIASTAKV